ncbi:MAG: porin, partial [Burkholderiales bacterium]
LMALAVAGAFLAPAAAWADGSGIVLTGVIHGGINIGEEETDGGDKVYKRQPNIGTFATRWEIDGTEDLGWSQVIFGLAVDQKFAGACSGSNNICNTNNINDLNNRNSFLGLTGGWGTLKVGQNEHQYEIQQILQDPDPASENTFGTLSLMTGYGVAGLPGFTRRDAQSIWYKSPDFGGFSVDLAYITPAGRKNDSISPQGVQVALQWKSAFGLSLYGAVAKYDDEGGGSNENQAGRLGVGYGTEFFQVDVAAEQLKFQDDNGVFLGAGDELKRTNFIVSGSLNFGQHHIRAAYNQAQKAKLNGSSVDDSGARLFLVGYAYTLSKRTELQVNYGKVDNKNQAQYLVTSPGNDASKFDVGIRHSF